MASSRPPEANCSSDEKLSATAVKKANGWLAVFWLANFPPFVYLYVVMSDTQFAAFCLFYLGLVSIWANVAGHFSAWVAGRVDVKVEEEE